MLKETASLLIKMLQQLHQSATGASVRKLRQSAIEADEISFLPHSPQTFRFQKQARLVTLG